MGVGEGVGLGVGVGVLVGNGTINVGTMNVGRMMGGMNGSTTGSRVGSKTGGCTGGKMTWADCRFESSEEFTGAASSANPLAGKPMLSKLNVTKIHPATRIL